mmetsp:Transcript_95127/g.268754  ORF Transcript_95127/g.268754 Transcript_95127/m.268754 type:complete len:1140 (+) Transcript_95127:126-3545(+)
MLSRLWKKKEDDGAPKATRANLGEQNAMWFDKEKGRWRERGKEDDEKEDEALAPPPTAMTKKPEGADADKVGESGPSPPEAKKEMSAADALCAPPNPYAARLGANRKVAAPPPMMPFGAPPPLAPATASGADGEAGDAGNVAAPPSNPFGAMKAPAVASNPFAPKAFGGGVAGVVNPNAPCGFGGGVVPGVNPNAPKGFGNPNAGRVVMSREEREKIRREKAAMPQPDKAHVAHHPLYGNIPAYSPGQVSAPMPAAPALDPKGDDPEGTLQEAREDAEGGAPVERPPQSHEPDRPAECVESPAADDGAGDASAIGAGGQPIAADAASPTPCATPPVAPPTTLERPATLRVRASPFTVAGAPPATHHQPAPVEDAHMPVAAAGPQGREDREITEMRSAADVPRDGDIAEREPANTVASEDAAEEFMGRSQEDEAPQLEIEASAPTEEAQLAPKAEEAPGMMDSCGDVDLNIGAAELLPVEPDAVAGAALVEPFLEDSANAAVNMAAAEPTLLDGLASASNAAAVSEEGGFGEAAAPARASDNMWGDLDIAFDDADFAAPERDIAPPPAAPPMDQDAAAPLVDLGTETAESRAEGLEPVQDAVQEVVHDVANVTIAPDVNGGATEEPSVSGNGESTSSWVVLSGEGASGGTFGSATLESPVQAQSMFVPAEGVWDEADQAAVEVAEAIAEHGLELTSEDVSAPLLAQIASLRNDMSELQRRCDNSEQENAQLHARTAELERRLREMEGCRNEATIQREEAQRSASEAMAQRDDLERKLCEAEAQRDSALRSVSEVTSQRDEAVRKAFEAMTQRDEAVRKALEAEERAVRAETEAAAASTAAAEAAEEGPKARSKTNEGDEFNLPDFVWNCGNSEVMAYVQKLVAENADLRRAQPVGQGDDPGSAGTKFSAKPFDPTLGVDQALVFVSAIGENDGHQIPSLLSLLKEHVGDARVCAEVATALETLTFTDMDNRQTIVQFGGVEAIATAMDRHQANEAVQRPAMDALWNLTFDDEALDRFTEGEGGGIERVVATMRFHVKTPEIQGGACAVFLNLAVREHNRLSIAQCGALEAIGEAMRRHAHNEDVLEQGCQALYMLAYHPDLRPLVIAAKGGEAAALALSHKSGSGRAQKWGRWLQEVLAC